MKVGKDEDGFRQCDLVEMKTKNNGTKRMLSEIEKKSESKLVYNVYKR